MKKIIVKLICSVFVFYLSGCGGSSESDTEVDGEEEGDVQIETNPDTIDGMEEWNELDADVEGDGMEEEELPGIERLVILHTNDEHSHILGTGPNVDDWPLASEAGDGSIKGNIYRRAVMLNRLKSDAASKGEPVIVVSAGDYTMGTLFHLGSVLEGIDYKLLSLLDYDAVTIGNHEFDFGVSTLANMLERGGLFEGVPLDVPVISSNIHFSSSSGDDSLENLYSWDGSSESLLKGYYIKTLPSGLRIGFIGMMGLNAALVAPFKTPVNFSLSFTDRSCTADWQCEESGSCVEGKCLSASIQNLQAHMPALIEDVANAVREVRNQGVDLVVALSHAGVDSSEAEAVLNGSMDPLNAVLSEDLVIAREVQRVMAGEGKDGIDVIVGGHTHTPLTKPIVVPDPAGGNHETIVVQAGAYGRYLGKLEIYRNSSELFWHADMENSMLYEIDNRINISELPGAAKWFIDQIVEGTMSALEGAILQDAINTYNPLPFVSDNPSETGDLFFYRLANSDFDIKGEKPFRETPLMHLVTDAPRYILNNYVFSSSPVRVYVQANGVIRDSLLRSRLNGAISVADTFNVLPLGVSPVEESPGNSIISFYLSAQELKAGLEVGLSMGFESDDFFLGYSGVKVDYDPNLPVFDPANPSETGRITKMTLWDPVRDAGLQPWQDDYSDVIFDITVSPDPFGGRGNEPIHVATNLYLGLFIEAFGLCPRNSSGQLDRLCGICANNDADCSDGMGNTAHCLNDAIAPGVGRCVSASIPAVIKYLVHSPDTGAEVKEWISLMGYLQNLADLDGDGVPDVPQDYNSDSPSSRYPSRICCVMSPLSPSDPCCHGEPCSTNFLSCP